MQNVHTLARAVKMLVLDVDGVLTDGSIYLTDSGEELKAFNAQDGLGMTLLRQSGVTLAIISGRNARCVEVRAQALGVAHLYQGIGNKAEAFAQLLADTGLTPANCAYIGDDVIDLPVMRQVGLAVAVPDAPHLVQSHAHYVTGRTGGRGAVRELCELILQAQGKLDAALARYLA